jgi:hypothetical protein
MTAEEQAERLIMWCKITGNADFIKALKEYLPIITDKDFYRHILMRKEKGNE